MNEMNGELASVVQREAAFPQIGFPTLDSSIVVDAAILGSGLTAMTAALHLHRSGRRVALIAPGSLINSVEASRDPLFDIVEPSSHSRWFDELGLEEGGLVAAAYRESISALLAKSAPYPECHPVRIPTLTIAENSCDLMATERECAVGRALRGDLWFTSDVSLPFPFAGASRDNQQCKLQLAPLLRAMALEFQMLGGEIFEHSPCVSPPTLGRACQIKFERGNISAKQVIFASRPPAAPLSSNLGKLTPLHSYFIAARTDKSIDDSIYVLGDNPRRMIWCSDRSDPSKLIIRADYVGDQIESQPRRLEELCCYAASHFSLKRVDSKWSHHRLIAMDGLPIVGRLPQSDNAFVAMGMGSSELPWGIACGEMLAGLIQGQPSPLTALFDPSRVAKKRPSYSSIPAPTFAGVSPRGWPRSRVSSSFQEGTDYPATTKLPLPQLPFQEQGMNRPLLQASENAPPVDGWRARPW